MIFSEVKFPLEGVNKPKSLFTDEVVILLSDGIDHSIQEASFEFHWLPKSRIQISFESDAIYAFFPAFEMVSNMMLTTKGKIISGHIGKSPKKYSAEIARGDTTLGEVDLDFQCDHFEFQIPNLSPILGEMCTYANGGLSYCAHRIHLEGLTIEIHPRENANDLFRKAKEQNGFVCTHVGTIRKDIGKIKLDEAINVLLALGDIISVTVSENRYPVLITGIDNDIATIVVPFIGPTSEATSNQLLVSYEADNLLQDLLPIYFQLKQREAWKSELTQLVFWYLQASKWSSPESTVVLTQVALEMASWVELVENGSLISQSGFEPLPASDKIRLLVDKLKLKIHYTYRLSNLEKFGKAFQADGVIDSYVQIRNALVHPKKKNRSKISNIDQKRAIQEAGLVGLHILEMYLLYKFGFTKKVANRITKDWELAPWSV